MRGNGELISSNRFINWRANCHVNKQGARSKAPFTHGGVERINQRERISSSFFFCQPESANPHFYAILRVFIFSINTQIMTRALFNPLRFIPPLSYGTDGQMIQDQMAWSVDSPGSKIYTFKKLWTASFCQPVFFFFFFLPLSLPAWLIRLSVPPPPPLIPSRSACLLSIVHISLYWKKKEKKEEYCGGFFNYQTKWKTGAI